MRLPNAELAAIPPGKVIKYLLSPSHPAGRAKAAFFCGFGFTTGNWKALAKALREHAATHEVAKAEDTPFGMRYTIEGPLKAPDGRQPLVRSVWFVEEGEEVPRLVTAYPRPGDPSE